jgi:hypothetical protein
MKKTVLLFVSCIVCITLIVGCASIMKGSDQQIKIKSTPSAAKVVVKSTDGLVMFDGTTPATVKLTKKKEYIVTVTMEGYKESTANITKQGIEGWFWGNIICGGLIGIVVDITSGAINKLGPEEISIEMKTAYLENQEETFVLFQALDENGHLRSLSIPMVKL